ncbi:site-specific integrase [Pseudenhygromyxa sp. WMMC2535]|uniref:site-specific integrase n=1 Tax=Pseudenhygromyxa sp. WMMC2535 TaxID=2712867 RepID=UPI0015546DFD|nr:site-specific integrase [Pseudenhygromyxa sp. WMMC2535]NVB39575.1 site-specific integrase [Pseudenhygromyxa sp. WMMC2535]
MGSVYMRNDSPYLWWSYSGPAGKRVAGRTPYRKGQEHLARRALAEIEAAVASRGAELPEEQIPTLAEYADGWVKSRKARGLRSWRDDERHLRVHILPRLGQLPLTVVSKAHVKEMLAALRQQNKAPRTLRNILSTLRMLYTDAIDEELVEHDPCDVHPKHLGPAGDKDPEWRSTAVYSRDELVQLISHPELPPDRRVLYVMAFFTGLRLGEVAGLRWRHVQDAEPLARLLIAHSYGGSTKNDKTREVPIHPLLGLVLDGWRAQGFGEAIGWTPELDDFIVPSPRSRGGNGSHRHRKAGTMRTKNQVGKRFGRDLELVGIRHRRFHDSRRTFISLAQADGAQREHLIPVTHSSSGSRAAFDLYTTIPWPTRCKAVATFRPVPPSNYSSLAGWILAEVGCYARCYVAEQVPEITGKNIVEAPGVESGVGGRFSTCVVSSSTGGVHEKSLVVRVCHQSPGAYSP